MLIRRDAVILENNLTVKSKAMSDNSKFLTGLLVGVAAGAAIGYFLTTDKGREILDDIKSAASDAGEEVKNVIAKGKKWAEDVEEKTNFNT